MAFSHVSIPRPTLGVSPLWGPDAEPHGHKWPDYCGFVVLPDPQCQWLITRHGSIDVVLANIGLGPKDKTWHHEQWLRFKFAGRKRRRDATPADSKSQQKIVLHTMRTTGVVCLAASELVGWGTCAAPFSLSSLCRRTDQVLYELFGWNCQLLVFWFLLTCLDGPLLSSSCGDLSS